MTELDKIPFYNQVMDKTSMKQLIGRLVAHLGSRHTTRVLDQLKTLGFQYATQAGISLGIDDLVTTPSKGWLIQDAEQQAHLSEKLQQHGSIHAVEKLRQLVETWYTTSEYLKREMTPNFRMTNPLNPVHLMSFSGARGSVSQVHQLVGMRGLMSDPQGQIIDLPIQSNFREGLSLTEYIISCYGARKGVVDTAVRTADAGYLTRRLVEVVQHVVVRKVDCGALEGVTLGSIQNHRGKPCVSWEQRLIGRVLAVSVFVGGQLMAPRNQEIGVALANRFANSKAMRVQIRSPMTCQGVQWVCQLCYGWSPSHGRMVAIGEAVGIIAGQSIGEPGTQLTLRTFHTGGVFTGDIAEHVRAPLNGVVSFDAALAHPTRTRHGRPAFICQSALPVIITGQERDHTLRVPSKSLLLVSNQEPVEAKQVIAEIRATTAPFKERVQKHIYSDLPGEMHWGKAVCHAPRRTRLSSLLATGHLWVLSGQLRPIIKQFFLFYEEADHIDQYQIIGDQAWIHGVRRAKCSYVRGTYHSVSRIFQRSLVCNHWSLGLEASLAKVQSVLSFPISFLLPRKDTHHHVTYHVLATCYEPQYQMESGGILKYGSVKTEPFIAIRNTALGSSQEYVQTVTTTLLREGSNSLSHIKKDIKSFLGKRNQEATLLFRVIQEGSLFWVPEETYLLAPSLFPYIQDGHFIVANSEIADGVFSKSAGLAQVNHLPHNQYEIHLLPGFLYSTDELQLDISKANTLVSPGELVIKGVPLQAWFFLELLTLPKKGKQWLLRPAMQFHVNSRPSGLRHKESQGANKEWSYCIPYADGARVNSQAGVQLLQTCLLHGPVSQQELQWKIQNEKVNQKVDPYDQSENVADMARFSLTERNSEAFVTNFSAGSLHSLIGTESFSEILILSRNDLLKTSSPTSSRKSLVANYVHVAYEHNAVGLIGHTCLPSGMAHVFRLDSYTSKCDAIRPSTRFSWRIIDEQATTHNLSALARLRFAELKRIKWSQLGQLMCEGISLEGEWSCPESGQIIAVDRQSTVLRLARPTLVTAKAAVHTRHAGLVREGDPLITLVYERLRSGDIIQGLPKVEQLLEARSIHARGFHLAHPKSEWKRQLLFALEDACMQANRTNFEIRHLQLSLIDEVQRVYQSQGVLIADKHVEIIVRQMTSKVLVEDVSTNQLQPFEPRVIKAHFNWLSVIPSYDGCLPGQFIELNRAHNMAYLPGQSMPYRPLLLGITKASFHTDSVLSEASFQQTIRALSLGALQGRIDWLKGLKEKVMIGDLIPAGTGCEEVVWQHEVVDNMSHLDVFSPGKTSLFYKRNQTLRHCASVLAKPHIV